MLQIHFLVQIYSENCKSAAPAFRNIVRSLSKNQVTTCSHSTLDHQLVPGYIHNSFFLFFFAASVINVTYLWRVALRVDLTYDCTPNENDNTFAPVHEKKIPAHYYARFEWKFHKIFSPCISKTNKSSKNPNKYL